MCLIFICQQPVQHIFTISSYSQETARNRFQHNANVILPTKSWIFEEKILISIESFVVHAHVIHMHLCCIICSAAHIIHVFYTELMHVAIFFHVCCMLDWTNYRADIRIYAFVRYTLQYRDSTCLQVQVQASIDACTIIWCN